MAEKEICILNDSFPPIIDGVANVVENYAKVLTQHDIPVSVVTPDVPGADDSSFDFPVFRYQSLDLRKQIGYTVGNPFSVPVYYELEKRDIGLLHSHCPMASNILARSLRESLDVPMIMTYHTKYDIDIANAIKGKLLQRAAIEAVVDNVSACDELWVVSRGAGENIRSLGYQGDYIVMENGVDLPKKRADEKTVAEVTAGYDLPAEVPMFLFVGRMMWYKGIRLILDALAALKSHDINFRMVFIGGGADEKEIKTAAADLNLSDRVFFTGPVRERDKLNAWYSRADLFLFPSTFDTNGLVVREAAASSLGTVLIKDSAAAEGVTNRKNGLLVEENAASLAVCLASVMNNRDFMRQLGQNAADDLYLSWDDAVMRAEERYLIVMDNYACGRYPRRTAAAESLMAFRNNLLDFWDRLTRKPLEE